MGYAGDRRRARGQAIPGWGMLLIGLVIGLFIAFLVYLDRLPEQRAAGARGERQAAKAPRVEPRFEFYSILPELEVVVPDILADKPREAPGPAQAPGEAAVYYLQAGSFKSSEEADRMKANLVLLGLDVVVQTVSVNDVRWHRVRVGPLSTEQALRQARAQLLEHNIDFMLLKTGG